MLLFFLCNAPGGGPPASLILRNPKKLFFGFVCTEGLAWKNELTLAAKFPYGDPDGCCCAGGLNPWPIGCGGAARCTWDCAASPGCGAVPGRIGRRGMRFV
jgi:hypothetical protein